VAPISTSPVLTSDTVPETVILFDGCPEDKAGRNSHPIIAKRTILCIFLCHLLTQKSWAESKGKRKCWLSRATSSVNRLLKAPEWNTIIRDQPTKASD